MKRIAIIALMMSLALGAEARTIRYFTYEQATRTVTYLNAQQELMIYYGYDYEIPTYVLLNEVWMERVNSAYYELWVYGWDAYTGDEIYMPVELQGVWLFSGGQIYNAAQYLRFRGDFRRPSFAWSVPPYNPYTRTMHRPGYKRSYHYDIHRHGWMPPAYTYGPGMPPPPLPPYYMRQPCAPAPAPTARWTPGAEKPSVNIVEQTRDSNPTTGRVVNSSHTSGTATPSSNRTTSSERQNAAATTVRTTNGTSTRTTTGNSTTTDRGTTRGTTTSTTTRGTANNSRQDAGAPATRTTTTSTTPTRNTVSTRTGSTGSTTTTTGSRTSTTATTTNSRTSSTTNPATGNSRTKTTTTSTSGRSGGGSTNRTTTRTR